MISHQLVPDYQLDFSTFVVILPRWKSQDQKYQKVGQKTHCGWSHQKNHQKLFGSEKQEKKVLIFPLEYNTKASYRIYVKVCKNVLLSSRLVFLAAKVNIFPRDLKRGVQYYYWMVFLFFFSFFFWQKEMKIRSFQMWKP